MNSRHILLDTCAGESVFSNRDLFYDIRESDNQILISGVNLDSEPLVITQEGTTDFGTVYYDDKCIANILSFGNIVDSSSMVRYVHTDDSYIVQMINGGKCYLFVRDKQSNIYICDIDCMTMDKDYINMTPQKVMVATVSENIKKYTKREVQKAELAREYQRKFGYASPGQLVKLISQGKIHNVNITAHDVARATDIWGPDLGSLKGKTTSHKAELQEEIIKIGIRSDQVMHIDLMFVNGIPYLISVFTPLEYVIVNRVTKKDEQTLWNSLISHINHIKKHGFHIPIIRVDGESAMSTQWFIDKVNAEGTTLDVTGAAEAVPVVERKIRHVKEKLRAIINTLPYNLTEQLESWLIKYAVSRIVLVPTSNSTEYISPREKLYGRKINVQKELKHGYGDYVQVHKNTIDNSMTARTQGAIALMPTGNLEGSWYYLLLSNFQVVRRNKATTIPITDDIIDYLNDQAKKKGRPNKYTIPIFERGSSRIIIQDDLSLGVIDTHQHNQEAEYINPTQLETDIEYIDDNIDDIQVENDLEQEYSDNSLEPPEIPSFDSIEPVIYDDISLINQSPLEDISEGDTIILPDTISIEDIITS